METTPALRTAEFWIHLAVQVGIWASQLIDVATGSHTNIALAGVLSVAMAAAHTVSRGIGRAATSPQPGIPAAASSLLGEIEQGLHQAFGSAPPAPPPAVEGPPPRSGGTVTTSPEPAAPPPAQP